MDRKVERIDKTLPIQPRRINVAAYCRVSSGKDAMLHSLSAQVSYYTELINSNPKWNYCGIYADEALTGTKDSRENFQTLLADCRKGKINMVITKSISRFARNTLTLLNTVRELKALGIDVYFEEQNIHTLSGEGELMLTILASYAQEESRSASENQKWRIRKSYERGEVLQWRHLYGYNITKDKVEINREQAEVVKEIFQRAINGESFSSICRDLNERKIYSTFGKKWTAHRITVILSCEKYIGDALLQKYYVNNHIEKKALKNTGQLPMFYAEGTHEPIIDKETYEKAQRVLALAKESHGNPRPPKHHIFTGKIQCGNCGENFKRITTKGKIYWSCRNYQEKGKAACNLKQIPEEILKSITADVLGLDYFDEAVFSKEIRQIIIPRDKHIVYVFTDGHREERTWNYPSRSASWTSEMKEKARQKTLQQRRNTNGSNSPFRNSNTPNH